MTTVWDVIIIGGGFNGLVAAIALAERNVNVLVVERRVSLGGAAANLRLSSGIEFSGGAHWLGMTLEPVKSIIAPSFRNIEAVPADPPGIFFDLEGRHLILSLDNKRNAEFFTGYFGENGVFASNCLEKYVSELDIVTEILEKYYKNPYAMKADFANELSHILGPSKSDKYCNGSLLDVTEGLGPFDILRAALMAPALSLSNGPPDRRGSAICAVHMNLAQFQQVYGSWGLIRGGMGRLIDAMRAQCVSAGTVIQKNCDIKRIIQNPECCHLFTKEGFIASGRVILYTGHINLLPAIDGMAQSVSSEEINIEPQARDNGTSGVVVFELSRFPNYIIRNNLHNGIFVFCPSLAHISAAWNDYLTLGFSRRPIITFSLERINSTYLLYCYCQYVRYQAVGSENESLRTKVSGAVTDILKYLFNDFASVIKDIHISTPLDLEVRLGLYGGHPEHRDLIMPNHFEARRPFGGNVGNVLICGASSYPGGNLMGLSGYHAAHRALRILGNTEVEI